MTTDTEKAFIAAICHTPADDVRRLAFADWLDENGRPERAEFIRVQCELAGLEPAGCPSVALGVSDTCGCPLCSLRRRERELFTFWNIQTWFREPGPVFNRHTASRAEFDGLEEVARVIGASVALVRRGFVESIHCPLATLLGDVCRRCGGTGDRATGRGATVGNDCPDCDGTGHTPGIAAAVFREHPVTRVVTDREPMDVFPGAWCWGRSYTYVVEERHRLPGEVFDHLTPTAKVCERVDFPTRGAALAALSDAAVAYGRMQAGLLT